MSPVRAVIIGSGASGGTVARVLARSGAFDVTVLDKGRNYYTGLGGPPSQVAPTWANDEIGWEARTAPIAQDPMTEPRSFRVAPSNGKRSFVGDVNNLPTTVGGATTHYDAKARRLREVDFITNTLMGGTPDKPAIDGTSYADWPMEYRHLEPFYAVMEEIIGVQGPARRVGGKVVNPNPYESWRSTPFPMPPGTAQLGSLLPSEAAERLGYHAAPVPTAVASRPYRGRPPCDDCGFCLGYGCVSGAKGTGIWPLNDALQTGRCTLISEANVVEILYDGPASAGARHKARGVVYLDALGVRHTLDADLVIVANTPIEATRLSLLSGIGARNPNESSLETLVPTATDPSGMLGRNLMFHFQTAVIAFVDADIHSSRGRTSTHTLDAFVGAGPTPAQFDPTVLRGGILEIGGNLNPVTEASYVSQFLSGADHKAFMDVGLFHNHITTFTMQGEDMPQLTNYVDIDPDLVDVWGQPVPRITYASHPYEIAASKFYTPLMMEILEAIGGPGSKYPTVKPLAVLPLGGGLPSLLPGPIDPFFQDTVGSGLPFSEVPTSAHILGTHRMALDPQHGPCDPYGRYWAFDNLYYAGGGLQPTSPGYNVTLTFWALSYWLAASIVAGVGGQATYRKADIDAGLPKLLNVLRTVDPDTMIARVV